MNSKLPKDIQDKLCVCLSKHIKAESFGFDIKGESIIIYWNAEDKLGGFNGLGLFEELNLIYRFNYLLCGEGYIVLTSLCDMRTDVFYKEWLQKLKINKINKIMKTIQFLTELKAPINGVVLLNENDESFTSGSDGVIELSSGNEFRIDTTSTPSQAIGLVVLNFEPSHFKIR